MHFVFVTCPQCMNKNRIPTVKLGRKTKCANCSAVFAAHLGTGPASAASRPSQVTQVTVPPTPNAVSVACGSCHKEINLAGAFYQKNQGRMLLCPHCKGRTAITAALVQPVVPALPSHSSPGEMSPVPETAMKDCPYCGEAILSVAKKCKHCGEFLAEKQQRGVAVDAPPCANGAPDQRRVDSRLEHQPAGGDGVDRLWNTLRGKGGLHRQRVAIIIAAGAGMLATFLPWVHVPILGAISGTKGDGWITLLLFIPALVLALVGDRSTPIIKGRRLGAVIPAGLAALIGIWKIIDFNTKMADVPKNDPFAQAMSLSVEIGIGLYLLVVAGVGLCVLAWVLERRRS